MEQIFERQPFMNPKDKLQAADTLLQISGGQDSAYVAWKWLTENPDKVLFLHHINLYHPAENRLVPENEAVRKILKFFDRNRLKNYVYFESGFSYGTLPCLSIKDIQICALFAGIILRTPQFKNIKTLLLSWHQGEVDRVDINRGFRVKDMFKALDIEGIDFQFPIIDMTREQMAAEMPERLLKLVHTCRRPSRDGACGKCKTCLEMKEAGIFRGVIFTSSYFSISSSVSSRS